MGELRLGARRTDRARQPTEVVGADGPLRSRHHQLRSAERLQRYAGTTEVTRRSAKHELVVANRLACKGHLRDAVQQWAFCRLRGSGWARKFYDAHRAEGKGHDATLRALGNRWVAVLQQGAHP